MTDSRVPVAASPGRWWVRVGLLIASTLVAIAVVLHMLAPTPAIGLSDDATDQAVVAIIGVGGCGVSGDVMHAVEPLAPTEDSLGWTTDGRFVGSLDDAAAAFNGKLLSADSAHAWLATSDENGQTYAFELVRFVSLTGKEVWVRGGVIRKGSCAIWK